jgi:subtilisin family serine protease
MTHQIPKRAAGRTCPSWIAWVSILAVLGAGCGSEVTSPTGPDKGQPAPAPHVVLPPMGQQEWVSNQLVVRLTSDWTIDDLHRACNTFTVEALPAENTYLVGWEGHAQVYELAAYMVSLGYCEYAEPNYLLESPETEQTSLAIYEGTFSHGDYVDQGALARVGAVQAHAIGTGAGVLVAVIDTGINQDHPDLAGHISAGGWDFIDKDPSPDDLPNGVDDNRNGMVDEATGHGTHISGILVATAPGASILPLRVLDSDGTGTSFNVTQAIYRAIGAGARVINLSLGMDHPIQAISHAIEKAHQQGAVVVASAGNSGMRDEDHFPAQLPTVASVAATDADDRKADFSSYSSHVSVSAPGVGIMSTYWNGGYAIWSGTSMSVPFVAGAAALRLSVDPEDPDIIQELIEETSAKFPGDCPDSYAGLIGRGRVDLYSLVRAVPRFHAHSADLAR